MRIQYALFTLACFLPLPRVLADVGDPTIRTSHPHYPGEGAFQTVEDCVKFATEGRSGSQEKAIALYEWLLSHQFHLFSPQEWNVPGATPGAKPDDYELVVWDANRSRFSYGYGLCGTVHAWNEPYWRALGLVARRRAFPGHVNSEVEYDGAWHAFDTDMAGLIFRRDGVVAGYDDIARDPSLVKLNQSGIVCYPFAWPGDFETMKKGWEQIAAGGNWYSMYNSGYAALPGVVHLRRGETFTRHFDRDVFGGPTKRRFWHVQKDGPFRNWTFVNMGKPIHQGEQSNARGNASYANAVFHYRPDFTLDAWREGIVACSPNLSRPQGKAGEPEALEKTPSTPAVSTANQLSSRDNQPAFVTFQHFSPYVICGDPADDTNPMSGKATDGCIVAGMATGKVLAQVSVDQGQSWHTIGELEKSFRADLTEQVKGRYGWWIRFDLASQASLSDLSFETTCQVNQSIYPRLTPNGCQVTYQVQRRGVTVVKPNFGLEERHLAKLEVAELRSPNVRYTPRSTKQLTAYTTNNNKPGEIVFRVAAPSELVEISAAARYRVRSPQPEGCEFRLDLSTDEGQTWQVMARAHNAPDNEYSSGWVYGRTPIKDSNTKSVLVRVHLNAGGYQTGLIDFEAYGLHRTQPPDRTEVTWAWRQPGSTDVETNRRVIDAGTLEDIWTVRTPAELQDAWVQIRVP